MGLVVETVGSGEHEDRHAAAGGDDAFGDLVTGRSGNVSVEDGDVVGVEAQQLQSGVAVTRDVCRDRSGVGHRGWLLPYRARPQRSTHACSDANELAHIAGIEKHIRADNTTLR